MFSPNLCASILDSRIVFPCSLVRMVAISSTFWSMWWAALCSISARLLFGSFDQVTNALAAALAALSTSAGPPAGTSSTTSPVAGLRTSYVLPDAARVLSPSMIIVAISWGSLLIEFLGLFRQCFNYRRRRIRGFGGLWDGSEAREGRRRRNHRARQAAGQQLRLRLPAGVRERDRRRAHRPEHQIGNRGDKRVRQVLL